MLDVIVCGVAGRMGGTVVRVIQQTPGVKLVGALDRPGSPRVGKDAGELVGVGKLRVPISDRLESKLKSEVVLIDFSRPAASLGFLKESARRGLPIVIGTTGFTQKEWSAIKRLGRRTRVLVAPNMSLGINLLLGLLGPIAQALGREYDVEIVEMHHRYKKDAPSGTALALGRVVAKALRRKLDRVAVFGRKGLIGERGRKEIGLLSIRAGDVIGEHSVIFGGLGERLEFVHRAHSRETFARGAIRAAQWLVGQNKGLYSMQDVLNFNSSG